ENTWEEIDQGAAGANYGWAGSNPPLWEGFMSSAPSWANYGHYQDPLLAYNHRDANGTLVACAITGGAFYPSNSQFGSAYAGKYFFNDFCGGFIHVFNPANPGSAGNP